MMLPRNSTTESTCSDLRTRYCMQSFLTCFAFEPGGEARRVEFVILAEDRVDGIDGHGAAVIAQAVVGPVAQFEAHARFVQAGRTCDAHEVIDGLVHVVGEPCALSDLAVVREIGATRTELHEPHDGTLELSRVELRGRGGR